MFDQNHRCEVKTPQARSRYNAAVRCRAVHGSCARRCCVHKFLACCLDDEFKKGADCCLLTFWWGVIDRVWGCTYCRLFVERNDKRGTWRRAADFKTTLILWIYFWYQLFEVRTVTLIVREAGSLFFSRSPRKTTDSSFLPFLTSPSTDAEE